MISLRGIRHCWRRVGLSRKMSGYGVASEKMDCRYLRTTECNGCPSAAKAFSVGSAKTVEKGWMIDKEANPELAVKILRSRACSPWKRSGQAWTSRITSDTEELIKRCGLQGSEFFLFVPLLNVVQGRDSPIAIAGRGVSADACVMMPNGMLAMEKGEPFGICSHDLRDMLYSYRDFDSDLLRSRFRDRLSFGLPERFTLTPKLPGNLASRHCWR